MSPTWKTNQVQENGQRHAKSSRCGTAPGFSQKLATGLQSMVPALRDLQPYVLRVRVGEARFFELADMCPTWSGKIQVNL